MRSGGTEAIAQTAHKLTAILVGFLISPLFTVAIEVPSYAKDAHLSREQKGTLLSWLAVE